MHWSQGVTALWAARSRSPQEARSSGTLRARFLWLWLLRHLEQGCLCEAEKCSVWNSMLFVYWGLRE